MYEEQEEFNKWNRMKQKIHFARSTPHVKEGEVWWCNCGKNVGVEINGKGGGFMRPVIIFKKFGKLGFLAIPLTSQEKVGDWYVFFKFHEKREFAALAQIKILSVSRLRRKMGELSTADMNKVVDGFGRLYLGEKYAPVVKPEDCG